MEKFAEAAAFAQAHEIPWPRNPAAEPARWGVTAFEFVRSDERQVFFHLSSGDAVRVAEFRRRRSRAVTMLRR